MNGPFPPSLEDHLLDHPRAGGELDQSTAYHLGARERHDVDLGVGRQGFPRNLTGPGNDIHHPGRESSLDDDLSQECRGGWREGGRLAHNRVPCGERRTKAPRQQMKGEVERAENRDHAVGFVRGKVEVLPARFVFRGDDVPLHFAGQIGKILERENAERNVEASGF